MGRVEMRWIWRGRVQCPFWPQICLLTSTKPSAPRVRRAPGTARLNETTPSGFDTCAAHLGSSDAYHGAGNKKEEEQKTGAGPARGSRIGSGAAIAKPGLPCNYRVIQLKVSTHWSHACDCITCWRAQRPNLDDASKATAHAWASGQVMSRNAWYQNGLPRTTPQELRRRISAAIYGWDCPLFDCGSSGKVPY